MEQFFDVLLTKTKEIFCIQLQSQSRVTQLGVRVVIKNVYFRANFWMLLYFFKSERGYPFQQIV